VGEGLNIVENWDLGDLSRVQALHRYLEASALAFADRNRYVGDETPRALLDELLSQGFADERACLIDPAHALTKPVPPGVPDGSYEQCAAAAPATVLTNERGTTNLTVAERSSWTRRSGSRWRGWATPSRQWRRSGRQPASSSCPTDR
jgi:gamma-glutamyltranspeptidase/glutathione hydrolase